MNIGRKALSDMPARKCRKRRVSWGFASKSEREREWERKKEGGRERNGIPDLGKLHKMVLELVSYNKTKRNNDPCFG